MANLKRPKNATLKEVTIQNFEDIETWQKARELTRAVYACLRVSILTKAGAGKWLRREDK